MPSVKVEKIVYPDRKVIHNPEIKSEEAIDLLIESSTSSKPSANPVEELVVKIESDKIKKPF